MIVINIYVGELHIRPLSITFIRSISCFNNRYHSSWIR